MADLFRELFLAQLVEDVELASENDVVDETTACQLHANDDLSVWNHHGNGSKVDLEVFGKLLAAGVTRILDTDFT